MKRGHGQAGVECGVALAKADDGAVGLGNGLHVRPELQRGLERRIHAVGDGVGAQHAVVGLAVSADVVGEIAARAENDFDGIAEACAGEFFGDDVKPCGAGAGEDGLGGEAFLREEIAGESAGALEEDADSSLVVEHAFIELNAGEADNVPVLLDGAEQLRYLRLTAHAGSAALDAEFEQYIELLPGRGKAGPELVDLSGRVDEAEVDEAGVAQQTANDVEVLTPNELVSHEDAAHAMLPGDQRLVRGGKRDTPRAAFKLHAKKLRGHGSFAVGREENAVFGDEGSHPLEVVEEAVLIEHGSGKAEVFAEEIPIEKGEFGRGEGDVKGAESFAERADEGCGGSGAGCAQVALQSDLPVDLPIEGGHAGRYHTSLF